MYKRLVNLLLSISLVGCSLTQTPIETADATIETAETQPEIVETIPIIPSKSYSHDEVMEAIRNEVRYTAHWDENCTDDTITVSYEDAQILLRIAAAEAADQGTLGMFYVMQTIMNRVQSPKYPNTVKEVVFQDSQFQPIQDGTYYTVEIPPEAHLALAMLECNKDTNEEMIAFEATWNEQSLLRYYDILFTHEGHTFYKEKTKKD